MPRKVSDTQVTVLLSAWYGHVYQREARGEKYSWNTQTDSICTQQTDRLYPVLLTLVDLPNSFGLNSRRFIPTRAGEELLIKYGLVEEA